MERRYFISLLFLTPVFFISSSVLAQSNLIADSLQLGQIPIGLVVYHTARITNLTGDSIEIADQGGFSFGSDAYVYLAPDTGSPGRSWLAAGETRDLVAISESNDEGPVEAYATIGDVTFTSEGINGTSLHMWAQGVATGN